MDSENSAYAGEIVICDAFVLRRGLDDTIIVVSVKGEFPNELPSTKLSDVEKNSLGMPWVYKWALPKLNSESRVRIYWVRLENGCWSNKNWERLD